MSLFGNLIVKLMGKRLVNIENELTKLPISPGKLERCPREAESGDIKAQFTLGGSGY
ncbi:MAG TPA: hypothetical protein VMR33_07700 [Candidatus Baltobacteraceae bacterium]|jgi:phage gp29-like protein|nr:hypothetical protein [Candidatus Baltobacteraceae bacterium]